MIWNDISFITSGITGLTLPGIIEEPFCLAGNLISPKPALGPDDIKIKSPAILLILTAQTFNCDDTSAYLSKFCVPSTRFDDCIICSSNILLNSKTTEAIYLSFAVIPVPTAVPPKFTSSNESLTLSNLLTSLPIAIEKALNSDPKLIGTASCISVLPIFITSVNSSAFILNS